MALDEGARAAAVRARVEWGVVAAVPAPFRGGELDAAAQRAYAAAMAARPLAGVAVWAHTGRGPHLDDEQRRVVLETWREAMPDRLVVAGAHDIGSAIAARRGHAAALLIFPQRDDAVAWHRRLSRELPAFAFWLYEAAGGVAYDDATLHAILDLPGIVGIKVATLDSPDTYRRLAGIVAAHSGKLLVTGEDLFLGDSIRMGARAALIGMAAACVEPQAALLAAARDGDDARFAALSARCDRLARVTFIPPMEGYVRRMLWAAAAEGMLPAEACDDPWGPSLPGAEREAVARVVAELGGTPGADAPR